MDKVNSMTVEELLKPRYKVSSPFPDMLKFGLNVGDILLGEEGVWENQNTKRDISVFPYTLKDYPNIFKKLQWWEERKESDMPEYVWISEKSIVKVKEHRAFGVIYNNCSRILYQHCKPAIKEEYLNQNK